MFFRNNKEESKAGAGSWPELWRIFSPAFVFVFLYMALQYACLLFFHSLGESGTPALSAFVRERPGLSMTISMVIPMALALFTVYREGRRRLTFFRRVRFGPAAGRRGDAGILVRFVLLLCTCSLCVLGNAQIQAMKLNSDSVANMQSVYREIPFSVLLLIFAGFTPFVEEFVFRGLLYTGLRKRFPPLISVPVAAACFGLYHGELIQGIYAFCMGLIFGLSMEISGDLKLPWLLHGLANGLPLTLSYAGLWEYFAGKEGRICTLICLLFCAGLSVRFLVSARMRERT